MRNVWMIDCNSLNDHLHNPTFTKCSDKRLSFDLAALRQMVWLTPDGELREKIGSDQARRGEMDRHELHGGRLSYQTYVK